MSGRTWKTRKRTIARDVATEKEGISSIKRQTRGNYISIEKILLEVPRERIARDLICSPAGTSAERSAIGHRRADIPFLSECVY